MAQLLSVNVGLPRDIQWKGKNVYTAVWKDAVHGRRKWRRNTTCRQLMNFANSHLPAA
jgi:hypothetical protein